MGICPNCGSWVDDGDICHNCGGRARYGREDSSTVYVSKKLDFKDVPFSEFKSYLARLYLRLEDDEIILNSIRIHAQNCTVSLHRDEDDVSFNFVLKNRYLSSNFHAKYDVNTSRMTFYHPFDSYDGLESMEWFNREVRRVEKETGLKCNGESGGYSYDFNDDNLVINNKYSVCVFFRDDDFYSDSHSYKVNFKSKKLEMYHVHHWSELFESVF